MIVSRSEVERALRAQEAKAIAEGWVRDGIGLPPGCSRICDLLGTMWFTGELEAQLPDDSSVATKLRDLLGLEPGAVVRPRADSQGG